MALKASQVMALTKGVLDLVEKVLGGGGNDSEKRGPGRPPGRKPRPSEVKKAKKAKKEKAKAEQTKAEATEADDADEDDEDDE